MSRKTKVELAFSSTTPHIGAMALLRLFHCGPFRQDSSTGLVGKRRRSRFRTFLPAVVSLQEVHFLERRHIMPTNDFQDQAFFSSR